MTMTKDEAREYQRQRRQRLKDGVLKPAHANSTNAWLKTFVVGEVRWVETTLEHYARDQRGINLPLTRRAKETKDWVFETRLFTAVSSSRAGDIAFLIRVERTA